MIRSTADYNTEGPNDYEFFPELRIFKEDLSTVFVATTVGLGETDCETVLPPIDDFVCGKIHGKALGINYKYPRRRTKQEGTHGEVRPRLEVEVNFTSVKRTLERGTDVVITSAASLPT